MADQDENTVIQLDGMEVLKQESAISLLTRAEIDTQIATAKAFPRSISKFMKTAMSIATVNEDVAASCDYALPRGGKTLRGPSVRLAEIVIGAYGNVRAGMRIIHNDGKTVTAQGICHDLETNTCVTLEVRRSILQNEWVNNRKTGRMIPMSEDMQIVTGNAACAIAFRNVVYKIIPTALITDIYEKVQEVAKGTAETLEKRKSKAFDFFRNLGVKDEQIFMVLDVKGMEDIDLDKLSILSGMKTSIKNEGITIEEMFKEPEPDKSKAATDATTQAIKDAAAKANKNKQS